MMLLHAYNGTEAYFCMAKIYGPEAGFLVSVLNVGTIFEDTFQDVRAQEYAILTGGI